MHTGIITRQPTVSVPTHRATTVTSHKSGMVAQTSTFHWKRAITIIGTDAPKVRSPAHRMKSQKLRERLSLPVATKACECFMPGKLTTMQNVDVSAPAKSQSLRIAKRKTVSA
jgi:hypothetical protein